MTHAAPAPHALMIRWGLPARGSEARAVAAYEALLAPAERLGVSLLLAGRDRALGPAATA